MQDLAELLLCEVEFSLCDIQIPEIVAGLCGMGIKLQSVLKCFQRVGVILLAAIDDP